MSQNTEAEFNRLLGFLSPLSTNRLREYAGEIEAAPDSGSGFRQVRLRAIQALIEKREREGGHEGVGATLVKIGSAQ